MLRARWLRSLGCCAAALVLAAFAHAAETGTSDRDAMMRTVADYWLASQQADIPASIAHVLGVNYCRSAFNGVFLDRQPQPAKYVVQARGDNRNRVDVYFDDRVASYLEDGDRSHWLGSERPPDADRVAAWIDAHRVRDATTLADER